MAKTVGIIAEYNPFHNGHYYHLQKAKQEAGADFCVAVISGNFTQRGETSIVNKWAKAYMAICGAELRLLWINTRVPDARFYQVLTL